MVPPSTHRIFEMLPLMAPLPISSPLLAKRSLSLLMALVVWSFRIRMVAMPKLFALISFWRMASSISSITFSWRPTATLHKLVLREFDYYDLQLSPDSLHFSVLSASSAAAAQSSTDTLPIGGGFATLTSESMSQSQSASSSSAQSSESQSASSTDSASSTSASSTESSSASTDDSQLQVTNGSPKVVGSPLLVSALGAVVWTFGL